MTLQDLIDYAYEKGFNPEECTIKIENFENAHLYNPVLDNDEVFDPMIVLASYIN